MKMNVFLTGNVQVGKSTAIKRFLEKENISPLGFTTHLDRSTGLLTIKIIGKDGDLEIKAAAPMEDQDLYLISMHLTAQVRYLQIWIHQTAICS